MRRREVLKAGLAGGILSLMPGGVARAADADLKLVIVGDGAVGKTSFLVSYTSNTLPGNYIPTVFDNYHASLRRGADLVNLGLWDTSGAAEYERLRSLCYPGTDVAIIAYSIGSRRSLDSVESLWLPELRQSLPDVPLVLVGMKSDLRDSLSASGPSPVTPRDGAEVAARIGAAAFRECSAAAGTGLLVVIDACIAAALGLDPADTAPARRPVIRPQPGDVLRPRRPGRGH